MKKEKKKTCVVTPFASVALLPINKQAQKKKKTRGEIQY